MDLQQYQGPYLTHALRLKAGRIARMAERIGYENIEPLENGTVLADFGGFVFTLDWDDERNQLKCNHSERLAAPPVRPQPVLKVAA